MTYHAGEGVSVTLPVSSRGLALRQGDGCEWGTVLTVVLA
jgi:hypothetical protein